MIGLEDTNDSTSFRDSSTSGNVLGDYIKEMRIGQGGFGEVYKALHRQLNNYVVIKILRPDQRNANLANLLVREGQVLTRLNHPNIVRVLGLSMEADDQIYLVMDYIDGGDLSTLLKATADPLPVEDVVQIISQVADGLHYVHQQHIIHRDLKPQNILRKKDDGQIVIADFGLAKVLDNARSQTSQSSRLNHAGTPPYMAPEHWDGKAEYRSDLYSLGVIVYQLLTKHLPFTGNDKDIEKGHRQKDPPPLRNFNPDLTPEIERVVLKMLEKDPEKRYQTALDFARGLRNVITRKTLKGIRTDPDHIHEVLESIAEDRVISLSPGEYHGPFLLDKRLHLIGAGQSTILYTADEPVLHVQASGVQLENMVIKRTHEGDDETVIQADESVTYRLKHVSIQGGRADEAIWEDAEWQLPVGGIDFGRIPVEKEQAREAPIEVKEKCMLTVRSNLPGLAIFPTHLSPGSHTLRLVFNASGSPPGTHLDGSIHLQGEHESREIHVTGQIEEPVVSPSPIFPVIEELQQPSMVWAYQLWDETSGRLLHELGDGVGKDLAAQWQKDKRNQKLKRQVLDTATSVLFELVGHRACRWFVRRLRVNEDERHRDEEVWELTLAIDSPNFPTLFSERKKTLRLECRVLHDGRGSLKVSNVSFPSQDQGMASPVTLPALVRLTPSGPDNLDIASEFMAQIQELPIKSANKLDVDQLKGWQVLLEFQSNQIKKRQYWAGYIRHSYREGDTNVTFFLNEEDVRNDAQDLIPYKEFQDLARKSRRGRLTIFATLPTLNNIRKRRDQDIVGSVERFHAEPGRLEIKLDQKKAAYLKAGGSLPVQGYLHFEADGDMSQAERHQEALSILKQGRATNPSLGDFFFDARKARPIEAVQQLQPADLLSGTCNGGQIAAIEAALSTRDLLLIQGPPGTGKTTVIAEICYQVALQGKRTLIASQSNLAVDNALGRIIHHPRVRALRKGNLETIEDEGRDYTEEHVVQKWVMNTAKDCQMKLEKRQRNIVLLRGLVDETKRFTHYRTLEEAWEHRQFSLQRQQTAITQQINEIVTKITRDEEEEKNHVSLQKTLSALLNGEATQDLPASAATLQGVFQYAFADIINKRHFRDQINDGLRIVTQVGLAPPNNGHLLEYLVWLKEAIHTYNASWIRSKKLINLIEDEIAFLSKTEHIQQDLMKSIHDKKKQVLDLTTQIEDLQATLQRLEDERDRLERAIDIFHVSSQRNKENISSVFKAFLDTELPRQLAGVRQFTPLEIATVFPHEVVTVIQQETGEGFLKKWYKAKESVHGRLQRVIKELEEYNQISDRFHRCGQDFQKVLVLYPEVQQELVATQAGLSSIPNTTFSQLVSLFESKMKSIYEIHMKTPGFMDILLKEKEKRLLALFVETRDLGIAAQRWQKSIPREIGNSNQTFARNLAASLSELLQQWFVEQQGKTNSSKDESNKRKEQKESELQDIRKLLSEDTGQLEVEKRNFDAAVQSLVDISQELSRCIRIPEALCQVAQHASSVTTNLSAFREEYSTVCQRWVSDSQHLETLVSELWNELQSASGKSQQQRAHLLIVLEQERNWLGELRNEQEKLEDQIRQDQLTLQTKRQWWNTFWKTIPEHLRPLEPSEGISALPFLEAVERQFKDWMSELSREEAIAQRYDGLLTDWISDLHNISDDDKEELQDIYIKNANVIGITCGQAPKLTRREFRAFAEFDTVIVDEVSKATAPELLLPAIMGKKLILIGDQHQLPPMIEEKTLAQMAEEVGEDSQTYHYLNQSYFKDRYNEAPDALKRMLSIQYRMHPDIMIAINQFYDQSLTCGINQPDTERDHQFESTLVRKNKHLIWVATPLVSAHAQKRRSHTIMLRNRSNGREAFRYESAYTGFGEEADGTSQINRREVEIIEKICEEFQKIWSLKRADGAQPKEIGVITFYAAQEKLLRDCLLRKKKGKGSRFDALNIRVGTVDRFQGMERAVIIVSMVRNNSLRDIGFARRDERINVAFSRAQELLVIVGCHDLFCGTARHGEAVERYNHIAQIVKKRGDFIDVSPI